MKYLHNIRALFNLAVLALIALVYGDDDRAENDSNNS